MKAVIVDIKGRNAVALTKSGRFVNIKNNGDLQIGYETETKAGITGINTMVKVASIAAALIFIIGSGIFVYNTPYSYIDIDINPSIEITTNFFDRIISAKALNNDAEKILDNASLKNKNVQEGLGSIVKSAVSNGYLKNPATSAIMLTVASKNGKRTSEIEGTLKSSVTKELSTADVKPEVVVEKVSVKKHDEAIKQGISPGKLNLIQRAIDSKPELKVEDLKDKPVKEILKHINYSKKSKTNESIQNTPTNTPTNKPNKQNKSTEPPKDKNEKKNNLKEDNTEIKGKSNSRSKENNKDGRTENSKKDSNINNGKSDGKHPMDGNSKPLYTKPGSSNKDKSEIRQDDNLTKNKDRTDSKGRTRGLSKKFTEN